MKKTFTLSLVATMFAGLTLLGSVQPAQACGNQNFQGNNGNAFFNTRSAGRYSLNNNGFGNRFRNSLGFNNNYNNGYFNNQFLGNNNRKLDKQQRKLARQQMKQQMAAAGIPFGSNAYNNGYYNNVANYNNGGSCASNANAAYNQGYNAGLANSLNNGVYNNGYYNNGVYGNPYGVNGLSYLNQGGVSGMLSRLVNRF